MNIPHNKVDTSKEVSTFLLGGKKMRKWWYKRIFIIIFVLSGMLGTGFGMSEWQEQETKQWVSTDATNETMLIPGGMPIGIYMETDGVLVLATECINCIDGNAYEPAKNLVKAGDYIVGINGAQVENKKELIQEVAKLESEQVVLSLRRMDEHIDVKMKCVEVKTGSYKLGVWVKDNIQGLGTVTYVTQDNCFGALGHGIHDTDTKELVEIAKGSVYETNIVGVRKGVKGEPGGLEGYIVYNRYNKNGTIDKNTENGIFGTLTNLDAVLDKQEMVPVCKKKDIRLGEATILCTVDGKMEEYAIKIKNIDTYTANVNKGIILEITDKELLELTGGIVQGMSGSPILQNGKIVGAVTHVLVNDPARGYGIFIEDMLEM